MDMDQIIPNLSFEVVAVPQNAVPTTTSYSTPIKVKIKMKKVDNNGKPRQGIICVPKMKPKHPVIIRKVHSDETIMSFNIHMEPEPKSQPPRKSQNKFLHIFKTGKCLDTPGEDENDPPYTLATSRKSRKVKSDRHHLGLHDKKGKINSSRGKINIKTPKDTSKRHDDIFGHCKPGGCLDPPYGEDHYQYRPYIQSKRELNGEEEKKIQSQSSKNPDEDKEKSNISELTVKNMDYNHSDASSTYMLYIANSGNKLLNDKYSDSIITYPTNASSRDTSILEGRVTSKKSSPNRNKQLNIDTYFTPTKIRKSQDKNSPVINTKNKNGSKEEVKNNLNENYEQAQTTFLLTDSNISIQEENVSNETKKSITRSNYNLSHLIEISGNILLTVNQTKGIGSFKSLPDEINVKSEIEVVNTPVEGYKNKTETITLKTVDTVGDEVSNLHLLNSSPQNTLEIHHKLDGLAIANAKKIGSSTDKVFNKYATEIFQDHFAISNDNQQKPTLSYIEPSKNSSPLNDFEKPQKQDELLISKTKSITSSTEQVFNKNTAENDQYDARTYYNQQKPKLSYMETIENRSSRDISEDFQNLEKLSLAKAKTITSSTEQVLKKNTAGKVQDYANFSNNQQEPKLSSKELREHWTPIRFSEGDHLKNLDNIANYIGLDTTDSLQPSKSYSTQENIMEDSKEKRSKISLLNTKVNEVKPQLLNLNILKENTLNLPNLEDTDIEDTDIDKISDKYLKTHNNFDIHFTRESDDRNMPIYSDYNNYITDKKLGHENVILREVPVTNSDNLIAITPMASKIETLKEINGNTTFIKESEIQDEVHSNTEPSFNSFNRENTFYDANKRYTSNLSDSSSKIAEINIPEIDKTKTSSQYIEKKRSLNYETVPDNTPFDNVVLFHGENQLSTRFTQEDITLSKTAPEINNSNIFIQNITTDSVKDDVSDIQSVNPEKLGIGDKNLISEAYLNELRRKDLTPALTKYTSVNISSSPISIENKRNSFEVYKNESANLKKNYQDINEILNYPITPTQQILIENADSDFQNQHLNMIGNNMSNKTGSIETAKYFETKNDLGMSYHTPSKQQSSPLLSKSAFDFKSNKQNSTGVTSVNRLTNFDERSSSNVNATKTDTHREFSQASTFDNFIKTLENTKNDKNGTNDNELIHFNNIQKNISKASSKQAPKIIVDLGFKTYVNENGDTILKTFDASQEPQIFSQDKIFVTRSVLSSNDSKLSFVINSVTRLSIKLDKKTDNSDERFLDPKGKLIKDTAEGTDWSNKVGVSDVSTLQSLSAIYENELLPIEKLIKNLRQDIDIVAKYRHHIKKKSIATTKKLKMTYSKRCVCTRK